jgi:hypothetical protein
VVELEPQQEEQSEELALLVNREVDCLVTALAKVEIVENTKILEMHRAQLQR